MTGNRYNNLGWFARHKRLYELGIVLLATLRRRAARAVGTNSGMKVLDIACGTGALSYELAKLKHEVTGIDLDQNMLQQAARKSTPGLEPAFVHGDATRLPFRENGFHAATIAFAMHDVPHEIGVMLLKEARRVLIPGGQITIIDYNEPGRHFFARILYPIVKLYESPNYSLFIKRGLGTYLEEADLVVSHRFTIFGGVQVVTCSLLFNKSLGNP